MREDRIQDTKGNETEDEMIQVKKLIEELQKFPPDAMAHAYEGSVIGLIISVRDPRYRELGYIPASDSDDDGKTVVYED